MLHVLSCPTCIVSHKFLCLTCLVPYAISCPTCLAPHMLLYHICLVFYYSPVSRALCSTCSLAQRASRPMRSQISHALYSAYSSANLPRSICDLVPHVSRLLRALYSMCLHTVWAPYHDVSLVSRTFDTLCANIIFCALQFPCLTLLFSCSFRTFGISFFWGEGKRGGGDSLKLEQ